MAPILQELDREWAELAPSPRARRALIRWLNTNPDLAGTRDLAEVAIRRDPAKSEPVLRALASLAPQDDIAARTLLQAMVPGIVRLATRAGNDDEAAIDELVSLAWERIRTYPSGRKGSVAANIRSMCASGTGAIGALRCPNHSNWRRLRRRRSVDRGSGARPAARRGTGSGSRGRSDVAPGAGHDPAHKVVR
jgi:hypothetical protein